MTLTPQDIHDWVQKASIGDELIYRQPDGERDERLFDTVRKLADGGLLFLFQKRVNKTGPLDQRFAHAARRTKSGSHETLDDVSTATDRRGRFVPRPERPNVFRAEASETPRGRPAKWVRLYPQENF